MALYPEVDLLRHPSLVPTTPSDGCS